MLLLFAYSDFMLPPCWVAGPELMLEMGDGRWEGGRPGKNIWPGLAVEGPGPGRDL